MLAEEEAVVKQDTTLSLEEESTINTQENFNDALKILATKKYGRSKITFGVF